MLPKQQSLMLEFPHFSKQAKKGLVAYATRTICTKFVLESKLSYTNFLHIVCCLWQQNLLKSIASQNA